MISNIPPKDLRRHLVATFPACFKAKGKLKLPLKIGIHDDIVARLPWLTLDEVKAALKDYTDGPKYLEQCFHGAWRVDLDGNRVSMVTYWQQQHSAKRLARLREGWAAKDGPALTLGDILATAFSKAEEKQTMASTATAKFVPGARMDRAHGLIDGLAFFDTIKTLANRGTFGARNEAVELIESRDRVNLEYGAEQANLGNSIPRPSAIDTAMKSIVNHMRQGRKIDAIKEYRTLTGMGLKESKDFVESLQGIAGPSVTPVHTPYGIQPKDYIVLRKSPDWSSFEEEGRYSNPTNGQDQARNVSERHPESETLLVKVVGRTKSVFSMVA